MARQSCKVEKEVKNMVKELVDLRDELDEVANDIAAVEADPSQWDIPLLYLFETMEVMAMGNGPSHPAAYRAMVEKVRNGLSDWLEQGSW
jgi:hypothetical protein